MRRVILHPGSLALAALLAAAALVVFRPKAEPTRAGYLVPVLRDDDGSLRPIDWDDYIRDIRPNRERSVARITITYSILDQSPHPWLSPTRRIASSSYEIKQVADLTTSEIATVNRIAIDHLRQIDPILAARPAMSPSPGQQGSRRLLGGYAWNAGIGGLAVIAIGLGAAAAARLLISLRRPVGACPSCRYDLRGLPPGSPCPECGTTPTAPLERALGAVVWRRIAAAAALAGAIAMAASAPAPRDVTDGAGLRVVPGPSGGLEVREWRRTKFDDDGSTEEAVLSVNYHFQMEDDRPLPFLAPMRRTITTLRQVSANGASSPAQIQEAEALLDAHFARIDPALRSGWATGPGPGAVRRGWIVGGLLWNAATILLVLLFVVLLCRAEALKSRAPAKRA